MKTKKNSSIIMYSVYTRISIVFSDDNANAEPEETQHGHNKIFQYFDPNVARWRFADGHHWRRFDYLLAGLVSEYDDSCK